LEITSAVTIDARSLGSGLTVDGQENSRIVNIMAAAGDFTFAGLTLTGGKTTEDNSTAIFDTQYSGAAIRSITSGNLTIDQSTVSGNRTEGSGADGGGIYARGDVTLTSSTISGNSTSGSQAHGGGIYTRGDVTIFLSTVTDNHSYAGDASGGGIWNHDDPIVIVGSIVAGNTAGDGNPDLRPGTGSLEVDFSLIGDTSDLTVGQLADINAGAGNLLDVDPMLAPLANNGGPTEAHALLLGSPAIDAGDPGAVAGVGNVPLYDQRGAPYDRIVGGRIDMGAVERDNAALPSDGKVDGLDYLVWAGNFGAGTATPAAQPAVTTASSTDEQLAAVDLALEDDYDTGATVADDPAVRKWQLSRAFNSVLEKASKRAARRR
jgi:hypothetical protein